MSNTQPFSNGLEGLLNLFRGCVRVRVDPCTLFEFIAVVDAHSALQTRLVRFVNTSGLFISELASELQAGDRPVCTQVEQQSPAQLIGQNGPDKEAEPRQGRQLDGAAQATQSLAVHQPDPPADQGGRGRDECAHIGAKNAYGTDHHSSPSIRRRHSWRLIRLF